MRKFFAVLLLLLLPVFPAKSDAGEVIVVLRSKSALHPAGISSAVQSFTKAAGVKAVKTYDALSEAGGNIFMLVRSDTKDDNELLRELKGNPGVIAASPNRTYHLFADEVTPNDPEYWQLWGLEAIKAPRAWTLGTGSEEVYVAVIDSGIDKNHPDLKDHLATEYSRNFGNSDTSAYDDENDHGTHVAGTIAAVGNNSLGVAGVNWRAKIISLRVANAEGWIQTSYLIDALNYVAQLLNRGVNIAAVNMSLGGWYEDSPDEIENDPYRLAMKAVSDMNKAVIAVAAGNEAHEVGFPAHDHVEDDNIIPGFYVYPGSFKGIDNMIVVAASMRAFVRASFSNYGNDYVDITAPGYNVFSSVRTTASIDLHFDSIERHTDYNNMSGTSMATPHVTGTAALLKSIFPQATASQIGGSDVDYFCTEGTSARGFLDIEGAAAFLARSLSSDAEPEISPALPHEGTVNRDYNLSFFASGTQPISWSLEGGLPEGLSFKDGKITGTPTSEGTASFVVTASNLYGTDAMAFDITITKGIAPVISMDSELESVDVGGELTALITTSQGSWPMRWSFEPGNVPESFSLKCD